jgi:hypothetical protein
MVTWASTLDCEPYVATIVADPPIRLTDYFGRPLDLDVPGAQSHLVEPQDPDLVVEPHYHVQDQYQVFVDTVGRFGRRELTAPVSVQYSDAYTPYGPFSSSDGNGLHFVTVRMRPDPGPRFLTDPVAREERRSKGGRQRVWNLSEPAADRSGAVQTIEAFDDGVGVHRITLEAGDRAAGHALGATALQVNIVIEGGLVDGGRLHPRLTHILVEADDEVPVFTAGDRGADVLVLGFRKPDPPSTIER